MSSETACVDTDKQCPLGALCYRGSFVTDIVPAPGFFRASTDSDVMLRCPNENACLGGDPQTAILGTCKQGYTDWLCGECEPDWVQSLVTHNCYECPSDTTAYIYVGVALIVIIWLVMMFFRTITSRIN